MNKTISIIGALLIISSILYVYISFEGKARIRVDDDKSVFYINDSGWRISGLQEDRLFSGNEIIDRVISSINRYNYTEGNLRVEVRETNYENNERIIHTWKLDPFASNIEDFPIDEKICIYNATNKFYRYSLKRLTDAGIKRKLTGETSVEFGYNMKVEFQGGYSWAWIGWPYGGDSFAVQYRINTDYECFDIRLFDPPTSNLMAWWEMEAVLSQDVSGNSKHIDSEDDAGAVVNTTDYMVGSSSLYTVEDARISTGAENDYWDLGSTLNFSVGCWVNVITAVDQANIMRIGNGTYFVYLAITSLGYPKMGSYDGSGDDGNVEWATDIRGTGWHFIVATRSINGNHTMYVDGIARASVIDTVQDLDITGAEVSFFARRDGAEYFRGNIDDCFVYKNNLTADEVLDLNNSRLPYPFTTTSVLDYNLTLNPLLNQTKTPGNLFSPNWSMANSQINMSKSTFAGGNFTLNLTEYNISTQGTAWTYNITNTGGTNLTFKIAQNHTKSNYDLWMWNDSIKLWNLTTTLTTAFYLIPNQSKSFNLTIDLFNASLTLVDFVPVPRLNWDFNITFNITEL